MKVGRKTQYGLLIVLYLGRTGRATVEVMAQSLSLSQNFLEQVARNLRQAGIIQAIRGPGGGYELIGSPTLGAVMAATSVPPPMSREETESLMRGTQDHRALAAIVGDLSAQLGIALRLSLTEKAQQLNAQEEAQLDAVKKGAMVQ